MRIRWTTEASDQLIGIVQHIQQENPTAALNVAQTVIGDIVRLETFPHLGPVPTNALRHDKNPKALSLRANGRRPRSKSTRSHRPAPVCLGHGPSLPARLPSANAVPTPRARLANGPSSFPPALPGFLPCVRLAPADRKSRSSFHARPHALAGFSADPSPGRGNAPANRPSSARPVPRPVVAARARWPLA